MHGHGKIHVAAFIQRQHNEHPPKEAWITGMDRAYIRDPIITRRIQFGVTRCVLNFWQRPILNFYSEFAGPDCSQPKLKSSSRLHLENTGCVKGSKKVVIKVKNRFEQWGFCRGQVNDRWISSWASGDRNDQYGEEKHNLAGTMVLGHFQCRPNEATKIGPN